MPDNLRVYSAGPLTLVALIAVIGLIIIVIPLLFLGLAGKAITSLVGLSWLSATALVILILLCSFVDIPVWKIKRTTIRMPHCEDGQFPDAFTPDQNGGLWETTLAVNLGGAVIPLALSLYLLDRVSLVANGNMLYLKVIAGHPDCCCNVLCNDPADGGCGNACLAFYSGSYCASLRDSSCR